MQLTGRTPAVVGAVALAVLVADVAAVVVGDHRDPGTTVVTDTAGGFRATFPHGARQSVHRQGANGFTATEYQAVDDGHGFLAEVVTYDPALPSSAGAVDSELLGAITGASGSGALALTGTSSDTYRGAPARVGTYTSHRYGAVSGLAAMVHGEVVFLLAPSAQFAAFRDSFVLTR